MPRVLWVLRILRIPLTLTYLSNRLLSVPFGDQQPPHGPRRRSRSVDPEIVPRAASLALFDLFASAEKTLHANMGDQDPPAWWWLSNKTRYLWFGGHSTDSSRGNMYFGSVNGLSGDYGGTYFMTQLIGAAKARELYMLSDRVSAEEALRLGLTNWVCEPEQLAARTGEIAQRLANGPAVAYRYMKENLNRAMGGEVDECLDLEATHHIHCAQTDDHKDAARAFVDKREPVFKGR